MTTDPTHIAKSIVGGARQLARKLSQGVIDVLVSNASMIDSFNTRREELTSFDSDFLFFYSFSLVTFSKMIHNSWNERDLESILEAAFDDLARQIAYASKSGAGIEETRSYVIYNLRSVFGSTINIYGQVYKKKRQADELVIFSALILTRSFPGFVSLAKENETLFSRIVQQFGMHSGSAAVGR